MVLGKSEGFEGRLWIYRGVLSGHIPCIRGSMEVNVKLLVEEVVIERAEAGITGRESELERDVLLHKSE